MNKVLAEEDLPMRVDNLTTVWTVLFTRPGRYHWMFQYYLRAEGLALSWVGTGRCLFSLDFSEEDYEKVKGALLRAARTMKADGWWDGPLPSARERDGLADGRAGKHHRCEMAGDGLRVFSAAARAVGGVVYDLVSTLDGRSTTPRVIVAPASSSAGLESARTAAGVLSASRASRAARV